MLCPKRSDLSFPGTQWRNRQNSLVYRREYKLQEYGSGVICQKKKRPPRKAELGLEYTDFQEFCLPHHWPVIPTFLYNLGRMRDRDHPNQRIVGCWFKMCFCPPVPGQGNSHCHENQALTGQGQFVSPVPPILNPRVQPGEASDHVRNT